MLAQCKNEVELRQFAASQQKTLMQIMKQNASLKEEVEELKKLVVNGALPIISKDSSPLLVESPEIEIAKIEINKLKMRAMDSEGLMLEEAKKLEIYVKILSSRYKEKQDKNEREVSEMDSSTLLAIIESPDNK
jgi:hypothetical protein